MTKDEKRLAEVALERYQLVTRAKELGAEMKRLARTVELPMIVQLVDDHAVFVKKPQYTGGMPQTTAVRIVR